MSALHFNRKLTAWLLGLMTAVWGGVCIVPSVVAFVEKDSAVAVVFLLSCVFYGLLGFTLMWQSRNYEKEISRRDAQVVVGLIWIIMPLLASLPYMFFPEIFSLSDAVFESYSGFTTTGSTAIEDFSVVPPALFVYRALTQWVGGLGFIVIIIIILKNSSGFMNNLFTAEFTSMYKQRLYPHLKDTVVRIGMVYLFLTVVCFVLLLLGEMDWFTALCHSLSTVATGGFSTSESNVSDFSAYSQWVIICVMFVSGISYFLIVALLKGEFSRVFKDEQIRTYAIMILLVFAGFVFYWHFRDVRIHHDTIREALFYAVSLVSSTGFDIQSAHVGSFVSAAMVILMFIGGCSASSASGLKISRVIVLFRYAKVSLKKNFMKHAVLPVRFNGKALPDTEIRSVFGFFFLYLAIFLIGIFLLTCCGNDFNVSLAMSVANLGNIGPVISAYVEDFSYCSLNVSSQAVLVALMLTGKLEIFSFFALFTGTLWKRG